MDNFVSSKSLHFTGKLSIYLKLYVNNRIIQLIPVNYVNCPLTHLENACLLRQLEVFKLTFHAVSILPSFDIPQQFLLRY